MARCQLLYNNEKFESPLCVISEYMTEMTLLTLFSVRCFKSETKKNNKLVYKSKTNFYRNNMGTTCKIWYDSIDSIILYYGFAHVLTDSGFRCCPCFILFQMKYSDMIVQQWIHSAVWTNIFMIIWTFWIPCTAIFCLVRQRKKYIKHTLLFVLCCLSAF